MKLSLYTVAVLAASSTAYASSITDQKLRGAARRNLGHKEKSPKAPTNSTDTETRTEEVASVEEVPAAEVPAAEETATEVVDAPAIKEIVESSPSKSKSESTNNKKDKKKVPEEVPTDPTTGETRTQEGEENVDLGLTTSKKPTYDLSGGYAPYGLTDEPFSCEISDECESGCCGMALSKVCIDGKTYTSIHCLPLS